MGYTITILIAVIWISIILVAIVKMCKGESLIGDDDEESPDLIISPDGVYVERQTDDGLVREQIVTRPVLAEEEDDGGDLETDSLP